MWWWGLPWGGGGCHGVVGVAMGWFGEDRSKTPLWAFLCSKMVFGLKNSWSNMEWVPLGHTFLSLCKIKNAKNGILKNTLT